jgi:hypothetical protein
VLYLETERLKMQIPSWITVVAAVVMAFPFGWGLGVVGAYVLGGKNFGQLPAATVPLGIVASIVFALWPSLTPSTRLKVMVAGSTAFILLAWLVA